MHSPGSKRVADLTKQVGSIFNECMWEISKGSGGCTLCTVLQQWVLPSGMLPVTLHSINCMELDCAINHKLIMIMLHVTTFFFFFFFFKTSPGGAQYHSIWGRLSKMWWENSPQTYKILLIVAKSSCIWSDRQARYQNTSQNYLQPATYP